MNAQLVLAKGETPGRVAIVLFVIGAQIVVARASKERRREGILGGGGEERVSRDKEILILNPGNMESNCSRKPETAASLYL